MRLRNLLLSSDEEWKRELALIGADACTWDRLSLKAGVATFAVAPIPAPAATVLKQCMLSGGADAIVSRDTITCSVPETRVLIAGTPRQLLRGVDSLQGQPFGLPALAEDLRAAIASPPGRQSAIEAGGQVIEFTRIPVVMGIINLTPDSFSDGGSITDVPSAVARAAEMVDHGARIVDLGAESTRPGSEPVDPGTQLERLMPVLLGIREERIPVAVSIDTSSAEVACETLAGGAGLINDVTALSDPALAEAVAEAGVPVIMMHMKGAPLTMQNSPVYTDVMEEVYSFLERRIETAEAAGIPKERIILDPGIGFGKRLEDNLRLIRRLGEFAWLGCRLLLGHSRKSFLGTIGDESEPVLRDDLSHVVSALACGSADILRVHDVKGTVRAIKVAGELMGC